MNGTLALTHNARDSDTHNEEKVTIREATFTISNRKSVF
jgi:hypothetical protein